MRAVPEYPVRVRPVVALELLRLSEQTAPLGEELEHANAAVNASDASPASMRHTTEAVVERYIETQWAPEKS
jgi:hypothetical protein